MCVYSQVLDHYKPEFDKWWTPDGTAIPAIPAANPLAAQLAALAALIAEFREALTAAKTVDRLTKQPDCEDPAKKALEDRVAALERQIARMPVEPFKAPEFGGCVECIAQRNNQDHKDHPKPKRPRRGRK